MLTKKQVTSMTINAIVAKMLLTYPQTFFEMCGNAAWISAVICIALAVLLFGFIRLTYTSKYNVIELAQRIGGKWLRIAVGFVVFFVLSSNIFSIMRIFPEIVRLVLLQGTYVEIIGMVFVATLILGGMSGLSSIARVHELFLPVAGVVFALFIILLLPSYKADNIFPIFGTGPFNVFVKGISVLSVFADLLMLNILAPKTESLDVYKKSGTKAIVIGGICVALIMLSYGFVYVYPISTKFIAPVYQLERLIHLTNFFSRFEAIFHFVWSVSILLYGSLYMAVLAIVWQTSFGLKYHKPLIIPIAAIIAGASVIPVSLTDLIRAEMFINKWIYIPAFAIPLIIGLIYRIKNVSRETMEIKQ